MSYYCIAYPPPKKNKILYLATLNPIAFALNPKSCKAQCYVLQVSLVSAPNALAGIVGWGALVLAVYNRVQGSVGLCGFRLGLGFRALEIGLRFHVIVGSD